MPKIKFLVCLSIAFILSLNPALARKNKCEALFSNQNLFQKIISMVRTDLNWGRRGYAQVDLSKYFSISNSEAILQKLISVEPSGEKILNDEKDVLWLKEVIGEKDTNELLHYLETTRQALSEKYGSEIGKEFETSFARISWSDGSTNHRFHDRWHIDNSWFTVATTLVGTGTMFTTQKSSFMRPWAVGKVILGPKMASILDQSKILFSNENSALIFSGIDRVMFFDKFVNDIILPIIHKAPHDFGPRLFLVQTLTKTKDGW